MYCKTLTFSAILLLASGTEKSSGVERTWAVHGSIVSAEGVSTGWLVFDDASILAVDCKADEIPQDAERLEHDGYIFPGLIDCHNHAPWNALPLWRAGKLFTSRYGWLDDPEYKKEVDGVYSKSLRDKHLEYASLKYAEVRALIGGTTLLQSTYPSPESRLLVRNLDSTYETDSRIQDITQITLEERHRFRLGLASGTIRRIFLHIGEGRASDPKSAAEFAFLKTIGLARPGVVVIHGVALGRADFEFMAANGMYLVWSPKSNEVLYGETARIAEALAAGVTVALAPDWTITGSDNVLEEMQYANNYIQKKLDGKITAKQLFRMVTADAARVAGVEERLGRIAPGSAADLVLAPRLDNDPFASLLKTHPRDIRLVFIEGQPVYGDREALAKWVPADELDEITVEGTKKGIHLVGDPRGPWHSGQHFAQVESILRNALPKLAPLIEDDPENKSVP